jgi:hypothetical protein
LMKMPKKKLYDCMKDFLKYILNICHFWDFFFDIFKFST